jgi:hypothetical protein
MEKTDIMTEKEFDAMLTDIEKQAQWANAEMKRILAENRALRAANLELSLKVDNLLYYISRMNAQKEQLN